MLTLAALAMMAALSTEADANVSNRPFQTAPQAAQTGEPVRLEDIVVTGQPLQSMIDTFVAEVAAPAPRRGLARWDRRVCVGVSNLREDVGQYLVDRVSTVAQDLGLETGRSGCRPNVIIVASGDSDSDAELLTEARPRTFRLGGGGMDRGREALAEFTQSDAPVRWWTVSAPVDSETGIRSGRLPGECGGHCEHSDEYAPKIPTAFASRLTTQIVDQIELTVVILDVDQVAAISAQQLADYVSMVVFAQINPEADTSAYASILNVFEDPQTADSLTQWDRAYLDGLYQAQRTLRGPGAARDEIAASIHRAHTRLSSVEQ